MMESCFAGKPERVGPVEVDDIRRDLLDEFTALPAKESVQSENLQVYLRVRPFTAAESDHGESQDCVTIEGLDTVVLKAPRTCQSNRQSEKSLPQTAQRFTFTQVFGPESSQRKVFEGSVRGLVRDVLDGGNCLVFTYGVTNAGKTFTFLGPDHDSGLLPRSLSLLFSSVEGRLYGRADLKPQRCRDFSRLTAEQQAAESSSKRNLLRLFKESDKTVTSGRSTFLEGSLGSDSSVNSSCEADSFCLDVNSSVRFSVWVSFCEIYNDNIHDLLEQVPGGHHKRTVLRLSQDVKGNSFIKDLRWVPVSSSEEAYRVLKIGRRNQSFSSTRLNQLSSRSHSIFSIRILKVDDVGVPRVLGISELALCDLAGSERCSRTHNTGSRLKEAGNINSSLLTLGKCISAMRQNQHAKFQHHVPFRESKLTHFLQFFFCGAGRVSMVVNINQNSSCFDETLNVLKFSALAQKVVVVNSRPAVLDDAPHRSALELSMMIDEADQRRNVSGRGRKSSMVAWETSLEDVLEDGEEWGEEEEEEEEESEMEGTVLEAGGEEDEEEEENRTIEDEEEPSDREAALRLVLEAQIREEVSTEFMELFNKMEKDYSERLEKEREILEERAETRVEILKNLVNKTAERDQQKDDIISSLRASADAAAENAATDRAQLEAVRAELLQLQQSCCCEGRTGGEQEQEEEEQRGGAAQKRVVLEEEIWRLQEDNDRKEEAIAELREGEERRRRELQEELRRREEEVEALKKEQLLLEQKVQTLTDLDECPNCCSVLSSVEAQQREASRLTKENKALVNGIFQLQTEVSALQTQLREQTDGCSSLSEQLEAAKTRLQDLEGQSGRKDDTVSGLTQEVERLRQEVKEAGGQSGSVFHAAMEELRKESRAALERSALKSEQMEALQRQKSALQEALTLRDRRCAELTEELTNHRAEASRQLHSLRAELESEGGALRRRLEEVERERQELLLVASEKEQLIADSQRQTETLRKDLERLKEDLLRREEEEDKENRQVEERTVSVVEELKGEIQRLQERRGRQQQEEEGRSRRRRSREYDAVKKEMERLQRLKEERETHLQGNTQDVPVSPLRSIVPSADRKKTPKTTARKRKSCQVEDLVFSENKRNRARASAAKTSSSSRSTDKEAVTTATKPRRGRKKLCKTNVSLLDSPLTRSGGVATEEKESDHVIIKRQLRSKTCRK